MKKLLLKAIAFALFVYILSWGVCLSVFWKSVDFEMIKVALLTSIVIIPIVVSSHYFYLKNRE